MDIDTFDPKSILAPLNARQITALEKAIPTRRVELIIEMQTNGVPVTKIADELELTRGRIYQILWELEKP